ncbi:MAG: SAM-dependent methyltransferase [Methanospirillum sp.]
MRARRYPADELGACAGADWVDPSRRPFVADGTAWVPVRDGHAWDEELPERSSPASRGYQRLGDLVLFHGPRPDEAAIRDAIARSTPRGVLWVRGHNGPERVPEVELLCGAAGEIVHRENGLVYLLDPSRVMFSGGNREEKARIAGLVRPGERTADLFAGIGYFTLPAARAGASVHAMEINPAAFGYLEANLVRNGLRDRVEAECGDCRDLLRGVYDRLVLGHFDAPGFLADALAHVRRGSVLHVHGVERTPGELGPVLVKTAADCGLAVESSWRTVKTCGPGRSHTVNDLVIL